MRTAPAIFGRTAGARPAVVGGLINGVAIGTPLLVGAASGEPAAGALTCIGATSRHSPMRAASAGVEQRGL